MKLVILDRDGVINQDSDEYIKTPDEWIAIEGSLEAIAQLNQAGYHVVVCTNQSGVGRGYFNLETLHAIHTKMHKQLAQHGGYIDAVFYCPHAADGECDCRKPKPGLLLDAAYRLKTDLRGVLFVGDSERDLQTAAAVGAKGVLVRTGKGAITEKNLTRPVEIFNDLADFTRQFLMLG